MAETNFWQKLGGVMRDYSAAQSTPGGYEGVRHNRAMEEISKGRIAKDLEIARARQETAMEIAKIRSQSASNKLEFDKTVEERKTIYAQLHAELAAVTEQRKRDELVQKWKQEDAKLAQQQKQLQEKQYEFDTSLQEKQFEHDNPTDKPDRRPANRIEVMMPDGSKQVIHAGTPEWDDYFKKQAENEAAAKEKANAPGFLKRNFPGLFGGTPLHPPPAFTPPATNAVPIPGTPAIAPPPMPSTTGTGTNAAAPQFAPVPSVGGAPVPALPTSAGSVPALGSELIVPQRTSPLPDAGPFYPPEEASAPATAPTASPFREGQRVRNKKTGTWGTFTNGTIVPD